MPLSYLSDTQRRKTPDLKRTDSKVHKLLFVGVATLLLATPIVSFAQAELQAKDVTALSQSASPEDARAVRRTRDNNVNTYAEYGAEGTFSLTWPVEAGVRVVSVKWNTLPDRDRVILVQSDENGNELSRGKIEQPIFNDCYAILPDARKLSLSCESGMQISEVTLFSEGALPEGIYDWQPPYEKADLLVVSAHCDDELIFFGGTIPYYAGERKLAVQVVYMANADRARVDEALSGLWHAGVRHSPVFLPFKDVYTETLRLALLNWGEEETTEELVGLIRRFQPDVIVSHDLEGEYGHGAHRATAYCLRQAVPLAADESAFPDSEAQYGVWQAKKLYLHLYPENQITMNWNQPLEAFGGKTALEVANEAYHMHVSQLEYHKNVYGTGPYSSLLFGLVDSVVGQDAAKNDFFEHVPQTQPTDAAIPTATPLPAATAEAKMQTKMPEPTGTPGVSMLSKEQAQQLRGITSLVFLVLGAGAAVAIKKQRDRKTNHK
jgi:LmbE family N-acetylglucosaminyl deacetylase